MTHPDFRVPPGQTIRLADYDPGFTGQFSEKKEAKEQLKQDLEELRALQDVFYAQDSYALLIILQAPDAAGKDGVVKHVMSGVNPQGCQVYSFKKPSNEELDHDFLWRCMIRLPERGRFGIFNRSYYEEVLVVRVHPGILAGQKLPPACKGPDVWQNRFEDINNFEKYLTRNGIVILKFFLHLSKEEQKERFLARLDEPEKNWKFSSADAQERGYWDQYQAAYEDCFNHTSTEWAPWHIIPADHKWFTRTTIANIIVEKLKSLDLAYPVVDGAQQQELAAARTALLSE
ncbi:MAG: polyphosphate kinase 2 family protein [Ardenticatenaceae bacterium]|nr:polyphosphate kinase 2 family protein [Ardenticatenaceae bacterium]MCB8988429.1 polyphosphate kinase 2 family protein [Ardenticatenaceae bacterium]